MHEQIMLNIIAPSNVLFARYHTLKKTFAALQSDRLVSRHSDSINKFNHEFPPESNERE